MRYNGGVKIGAQIREDAVGAWHEVQDAPVEGSLRILRADHVGNDAARLVFLEEVRRIKTLEHPALVRVLHVDDRADRPWMLTERVDGRTFESHVAEHGALDEEAALRLARSMLDALAFLETRRQVHAVPVPRRLVQVGEHWKLLTFRDIRAWDELKTLKGKKHPVSTYAPPERDKTHPAAYSPHGHNAWHVGALLRFAAGGGAPRSPEGTVLDLPDTLGTTLAIAVTLLTRESPDARAQGTPAVLRVLRGEAAAMAEHAAPPDEVPVIKAPVPRRKRRRP